MSSFPSSSNPTILDAIQFPDDKSWARIVAHRSFEIPFLKRSTAGRTLIPNFVTRNGTFSTKTRMKRVWKYFVASF